MPKTKKKKQNPIIMKLCFLKNNETVIIETPKNKKPHEKIWGIFITEPTNTPATKEIPIIKSIFDLVINLLKFGCYNSNFYFTF